MSPRLMSGVAVAALIAVSACGQPQAPAPAAETSPPVEPAAPAPEVAAIETEEPMTDEESRSAGVHVHGLAQLSVVQDGARVVVQFDSPGYNLVGFERPPGNAAEQDAVDTMYAVLDGFVSGLNDEAGCELAEAAVTAPFLDAPKTDDHDHSHDDADHSHDHDHDHGEGADHSHDGDMGHSHAQNLFAQWTFTCAAPDALATFTTGMFEAFPNLETLEVVALTDRGTHSETVTGGQTIRLTP